MPTLQWSEDTRTNWETQNRVPLTGEICIEKDTGLWKRGNGTLAYNSLPYMNEEKDIPAYAPVKRLHRWDPKTSSYNFRQQNQHAIRADIKKVQAGTGDVHIGFAGDSTLGGYNGSAFGFDKSIPRMFARALSHLLGDIPWTGGIQPATAFTTGTFDNITLSGGMTEAVQILTNNPTGASASIGNLIWKSLDPCTSVEFYFSNLSTNNFTYQIDGGSTVTVSTTGVQTVMGKVTVSGLTKGIHTIQINGTAAISVYIYGFRGWDPNVKSIHLHLAGIGGAKANLAGTNGLNWSNTQNTAPQGLGWSAPQMFTVAGITLDMVIICAGNNDMPSGGTAASTITGLTTIRNYWSSVPAIFFKPPQLSTQTTGSTQGVFDDYSGQMFTLADTLDAGFFDWDDWDGRRANYIADGLAGADNDHPTWDEQAAVARHLALLLTQADYQGPADPVIVPFGKSGTVTTGTGDQFWTNDSGRTLRITSIRVNLSANLTGTSLLVDVNLNGVTIYTTQGNRPTIASGAKTVKSTNMDIFTVPDGGQLSVDIDQVGTASGITVTVTMV